MDYDYSFFEQSLMTVRRLRSYSYPYYILDAAAEIAPASQLEIAPKVISMVIEDASETAVIDTTSYAKSPGTDLSALCEFLGNKPPFDFTEFYQKYAEALVVTRSYPIHLWSESKIVEEAKTNWRLWNLKKPIRFFRFGEYYDRHAQQFGLWQEPSGNSWKVLVTSIYCQDENYDVESIDPVYIMGHSFYDWLKDLIQRDGLPDSFIEVSGDRGFLDPA